MTIVILSAGTRNLLVSFFKESGFNVIATDCDRCAPALYYADSYYIMPRITESGYIDRVIEICLQNKADAVLPLFEEELTLIAENRRAFIDAGITPVISPYESVLLCKDKWQFYTKMKEAHVPVLKTFCGLKDIKSALDENAISLPAFMKPRYGAGSVDSHIVAKKELCLSICEEQNEEMLLQELADGDEYGVDVYVDLISHKMVSAFIKKKLRMRAGETEKSLSVKDEALFSLVRKVVESLDMAGPLDIDVFGKDGRFFISEINPRFGGGYPHAYLCGINFPKLILNNLNGKENPDITGCYEEGTVAMKIQDIILLPEDQTDRNKMR